MNTTGTQQNASIFLNYRREDSQDVTTRLHEDLVYALGPGKVFRDHGSIVPGNPWPKSLRDSLNAADVVIVVIGKNWFEIEADPVSHQRRLDAEGDWVRTEIKEALRGKKVVIPVLVRDAPTPLAEHFPRSIRELATRQMIKISPEHWRLGIVDLLNALAAHGIQSIADPANRPVGPERSFLGVIDYFYRQIGKAASGEHADARPTPDIVNCTGMSNLWGFIEDSMSQKQRPFIRVNGQLSPYAPLLCGNPSHKRQLHLELRQGAARLIKELGCEFGELLNGLLSYSAGQMVIRPYFQGNYAFFGLYESIVRNSIPVMIERQYYNSKLGPLFREFNSIEVCVQGFLDEIPNYTQDALNDFGITERLRSALDQQTIQQVGQPNYALFVRGDENSFIDLPNEARDRPLSSRYLDGDVWVANAANSLITRFIDISSREDMLRAVNEITHELRLSRFGRGILSSFDVRMAKIEDKVPDRVLSAAQLSQEGQ